MTTNDTKDKKKKSRISPMFRRTASHIFTKPATTKYPFVRPELPDDYRGKTCYTVASCNIVDLSGTGGDPNLGFDVRSLVRVNCEVCKRDCPANAIEIVEVDGKRRPQFDLNKCIFCYQCIETCPRKAIKDSDLFELATTDKSSLICKPQPNAKEVTKK
jgi:formate hydrogenlyase subunit 6/NADH:ubiquinone oxidoreductase subunit I